MSALARPGDPDVRSLAGYVANLAGVQYPQPGSFYGSLVVAMVLADRQNRARLGEGFPLLADMVSAYKDDVDGLARLRVAAETGVWP